MKELHISASPHIVSNVDTRYMMKSVIIALVPAVIASLYFFRFSGFLLLSVSVASCVLTEYVLQNIRKRKIRVDDHSAVVTGLLLAMVLPPTIPLWMAFLGGLFAITMGKELFGGIGMNIFNPALLARAFLMAAFPIELTTWVKPFTLDAVTTATPLGLAKFSHVLTPYWDLFIGSVPGSLGETSALALVIGGGYLLYKKVIDYRIPAAYTISLVVFSGLVNIFMPGKTFSPLFHILAGGFLIGALFMATDPVTTPITKKGRWVFGAGCGILTMIIRLWGGLPEGVMFAILLMNAFTPLINRITKDRRYGTGK